MGLDIKYIAGQTPVDEDERQGLKIKTITTVRELNEFEQLNIEEAVKWSMGIKKSVEDLANEEFIKDVHRHMYGKVWQWAGQFRNTNKNIGVDKFRIGIDLRQLCDDFKYWHQHNIYTPVERIIRFKHRLVAIHCFPNGNGRHSRLMADILADKLYGLPVFSWGGSFSLSSESDIRRTYLAALREADRGSYTSLINFATSTYYHRRATREVNIGGVPMGGAQPVRVQTMTTTNTLDVAASVAQCRRVAAAGADYVRLTTQGLREVEALAQIKQQLRAAGCMIPLIADVHFTPKVALAAAAVADKVRINPGNFGHTHEEAEEQLLKLIAVCRTHHTVLRIGVNHGSLAQRVVERCGDSPQGMLESAMEFLRICRDQHFNDVVVSMKASNTRVMVEAYRLLAAAMEAEAMDYPLHLGVTEAGDGDDGRIKSAVGTGTLLAQGLGDTVRVSLTEAPENEIPVAKVLVHLALEYPYTKSDEQHPELVRHYAVSTREELLLRMACDAGPLLLDGCAADVKITAKIDGKLLDEAQSETLALSLLQAARVRFTKPEYIACPGCGRTLYDLQPVLAAVKAATAQLKGLKIAVMGCIVNGPGEMADADYGYVGAGPGLVTLYKGKEPVKKNIPQQKAVEELVQLIKDSGDYFLE